MIWNWIQFHLVVASEFTLAPTEMRPLCINYTNLDNRTLLTERWPWNSGMQKQLQNNLKINTNDQNSNEVMNLAQIDHPGVIHMRGICFNPLGIVMEYIPFAGSGTYFFKIDKFK